MAIIVLFYKQLIINQIYNTLKTNNFRNAVKHQGKTPPISIFEEDTQPY